MMFNTASKGSVPKIYPLTCLALLALSPVARAQADFIGEGRFPQYRNMSGLPGGTFGVTPGGHPGIGGAMAFSTPIGYSLTDWRVVLAAASMSTDARLRFFDREGAISNGSNGTAAAMIGIPLGKFGRATISRTTLSVDLDFVYSVQYQIPLRDERLGLSLGAQDLLGTGGAAGEGHPADPNISRSLYAVATYQFPRGVYASVGWGNRRFRGGFANVSVPVTKRARVTAEYDGFGINFGATYNFLQVPGRRRVDGNLFFGYVRGRNPTIGLSVSF